MASIFNLAKPLTIENEVSRLRAEKQSLLEELQQCQADKDFVWSLWKRLQVASPDITEAIGMVVQREKEKAELKDQKVLDILQTKDDKIEELKSSLSSHTQEVGSSQAMKLEMQADMQKLKNENDALKVECNTFRKKVHDLEGHEHELGSRQAIREMDKEILDLKQKLSNKEKEVASMDRDIQDLSAIRDTQKGRISHVEDEHKSLGKKYQKLSSEYTDVKKLLKKYENEITILGTNLEDRTSELESARKKLSSVLQTQSHTTDHSSQQADVIRQLRSLQQDTQQTMKKQENTFSMETASLQAQLVEQEDLIAELERQLLMLGVQGRSTGSRFVTDDKESQTESELDMDPHAHELASELNCPQRRGHRSRSRKMTHDRAASTHERTPRRDQSPSHSQNRQRSPSAKGRSLRSRSEPRSRSLTRSKNTPGSSPEALQKRLEISERKFAEFQELLKIKNVELDEIKTAHARRLDRLRSLQSNYRLIKKQLKVTEEDLNGPRKKRRKIPRADNKALQKEDSDKVWNELTFFRNENSNLIIEKMNLQEEVDLLKVQTAQDAATIYELRSCLQQEREELEFLTEMQHQEQKQRSPSPTANIEVELAKSRKEVKRLQKRLKNLQEDNLQVLTEKDEALKDKRDLRTQCNSLQQKDAEHRIKIADLNRDLARLHRELKRKRKPRGRISYTAKQYQRILNRSIRDMQTSFDNFNQDGWEEISDSEDVVMEYTGTTDSLGQQIADHAEGSFKPGQDHERPGQYRPTARQREAVDDHVQRMKQRGEARSRDPPTRRSASPVRRRDVALSPIHLIGSKSNDEPLVTRPQPATTSACVGTSPHAARPQPATTSAGVGTSPYAAKRAAPSSNATIRHIATLKQRIHTLQHQVSLLRTSRDNTTQKNHDQKDQIGQLQAELASANQKLQSSRLTTQRVTSDLERLRGDKEILEHQIEVGNTEAGSGQHTDQEWNNLQSRLKTASTEVSKQLAQIKNLKTQHTEEADKIQQLQERVNHLERDLAQKRTLLEDMKVKLRFAQENAQTDADIMTEVDGKLKSLAEANSRYKTQVESFRQRLSAVSKQKHENDRKILKLTGEIDRKNKQVSEIQHRNAELQKTVVAIEKTAQEQLHALANQSEAAIDVAHSKLSQVHGRLQEHDKFVKIFSHALLNSLQQARSLWLQHKHYKRGQGPLVTDLDPSMRKAQALACDILNLSQSEMDDIMSLDGDSRERLPVSKPREPPEPTDANEAKRDKKWAKKVADLATNKVEFAVPLTEIFMEKVDERNKLAVKLSTS